MFSTLNVSIKGHRYQYSSSSIVGDNKRMRACHVIEQCDTDDAFRLFAFDPSEFQYLLPTVSLWSIIPIRPPPPPASQFQPPPRTPRPLHYLPPFITSPPSSSPWPFLSPPHSAHPVSHSLSTTTTTPPPPSPSLNPLPHRSCHRPHLGACVCGSNLTPHCNAGAVAVLVIASLRPRPAVCPVCHL